MNKKINLKNILKENIILRNLLNDYRPKGDIQDIVIGVDEMVFGSKQFLYFLLVKGQEPTETKLCFLNLQIK